MGETTSASIACPSSKAHVEGVSEGEWATREGTESLWWLCGGRQAADGRWERTRERNGAECTRIGRNRLGRSHGCYRHSREGQERHPARSCLGYPKVHSRANRSSGNGCRAAARQSTVRPAARSPNAPGPCPSIGPAGRDDDAPTLRVEPSTPHCDATGKCSKQDSSRAAAKGPATEI